MNSRIERLRENLKDQEGVFLTGYPNLFYYTGFTSEDGYAVITREEAVLITDSRYTIQAKQQARGFEIMDLSEGLAHILDKIPVKTLGFEESIMSVGFYNRLVGTAKEKEFVPMQAVIEKPRRNKSREEINRIHQAELLGDAAFTHILKYIRPGMREKEVAAELEYFMMKNGALRTSFETIAASGVRGAMPHGVASNKIIEKGELLTLDFGCVLDGYCSDMTRTVSIGQPNAQMREIYQIVLAAQEAALKTACVGVACAQVDKAARDIIKAAGYGARFGHSLGHSVGIEIHESPNFSPKSEDILQMGNVITVEPGIYVEGLGGVRIEDVIAVTEQGIENLTTSPKELVIL